MGAVSSLLKRLALCASLLAAMPIWADCGGGPGEGRCTDVRITLLYIDANYDAYISVSGNIAQLPCTPDGTLLKLPASSTNFKATYATLMAAHMTSRNVNVRLSPSAQQCTIAWVSVP